MNFPFDEVEEKYAADENLKREDVKAIVEWTKNQPHLCEITELQALLFIHSCYYNLDFAKVTIDKYFTMITNCTDVFEKASEETLRQTFGVISVSILPERTNEGHVIAWIKLMTPRTDVFNCTNFIKLCAMSLTLYSHQKGPIKGLRLVFDLTGASLGHLARLNLFVIKDMLLFLQEAAPVRLKGIHFVNVNSFTDKLIYILKPFFKKEVFEVITLHKKIEDLYNCIPSDYLPEDYGGKQSSFMEIHEANMENLFRNYNFFKWHETQNVDESRRLGKAKTNFGIRSLRKLVLD